MDTGAIKPDNIPAFIKREETEPNVEILTEEEKTLAKGADTKFWVALKGHINSEITQLDQIANTAVENGASMEQIGQNTVVVSQVKGVISKIFNVVEDAREAMNEEGKRK